MVPLICLVGVVLIVAALIFIVFYIRMKKSAADGHGVTMEGGEVFGGGVQMAPAGQFPSDAHKRLSRVEGDMTVHV